MRPNTSPYFEKIFSDAQYAFQLANRIVNSHNKKNKDKDKDNTKPIAEQFTVPLFAHLKALTKPLHQLTVIQRSNQLERHMHTNLIGTVNQEIQKMLTLLLQQNILNVLKNPPSITTLIGDLPIQLDEKNTVYLQSLLTRPQTVAAPVPVALAAAPELPPKQKKRSGKAQQQAALTQLGQLESAAAELPVLMQPPQNRLSAINIAELIFTNLSTLQTPPNSEGRVNILRCLINQTLIHNLLIEKDAAAQDSMLFFENDTNMQDVKSREAADLTAVHFLQQNKPDWIIQAVVPSAEADAPPSDVAVDMPQAANSSATVPTPASTSEKEASSSPFKTLGNTFRSWTSSSNGNGDSKTKKTTQPVLSTDEQEFTAAVATLATAIKKPTSTFGSPSDDDMQAYYRHLAITTTNIPDLSRSYTSMNKPIAQEAQAAEKQLETIRQKMGDIFKTTYRDTVKHAQTKLSDTPHAFKDVRYIADRLVFLKTMLEANTALGQESVPDDLLPQEAKTAEQKTYQHRLTAIRASITLLKPLLQYHPDRPPSYELDQTIFLSNPQEVLDYKPGFNSDSLINLPKLYIDTLQLEKTLEDVNNPASPSQRMQVIHDNLVVLLRLKKDIEQHLIGGAATALQETLHLNDTDVKLYQTENPQAKLRQLYYYINLPHNQEILWPPKELWKEQKSAYAAYADQKPAFNATMLVEQDEDNQPVYTENPIKVADVNRNIEMAGTLLEEARTYMKALKTAMDTTYQQNQDLNITEETTPERQAADTLLNQRQAADTLLNLLDQMMTLYKVGEDTIQSPYKEQIDAFFNIISAFISQQPVYELLKQTEFTLASNSHLMWTIPLNPNEVTQTLTDDRVESYDSESQITEYYGLASVTATDLLLQHNENDLIVLTVGQRQEQEALEASRAQAQQTLKDGIQQMSIHVTAIHTATNDLSKRSKPIDTLLDEASAMRDAATNADQADDTTLQERIDKVLEINSKLTAQLEKVTQARQDRNQQAQEKKEKGLRAQLQRTLTPINNILAEITKFQNDLKNTEQCPPLPDNLNQFRTMIGGTGEGLMTLLPGQVVQTTKETEEKESTPSLNDMLTTAAALKTKLDTYKTDAQTNRQSRDEATQKAHEAEKQREREEKERRKKEQKEQKKVEKQQQKATASPETPTQTQPAAAVVPTTPTPSSPLPQSLVSPPPAVRGAGAPARRGVSPARRGASPARRGAPGGNPRLFPTPLSPVVQQTAAAADQQKDPGTDVLAPGLSHNNGGIEG